MTVPVLARFKKVRWTGVADVSNCHFTNKQWPLPPLLAETHKRVPRSIPEDGEATMLEKGNTVPVLLLLSIIGNMPVATAREDRASSHTKLPSWQAPKKTDGETFGILQRVAMPQTDTNRGWVATAGASRENTDEALLSFPVLLAQ
jgi:hypothetical protein